MEEVLPTLEEDAPGLEEVLPPLEEVAPGLEEVLPPLEEGAPGLEEGDLFLKYHATLELWVRQGDMKRSRKLLAWCQSWEGAFPRNDVSLEQLQSKLENMPAESVRRPGIPIASVVQEASDLVEVCRRAEVQEALLAVGRQLPGFINDLEQRMLATRQAQSRWQSVRDQTKSRHLVELEAQAQSLRSEMLSAGRFNLKEREVQSALELIGAGESVDDLVQDLFDLATLFEKHASAFARDRSFDVEAQVQRALSLGQDLSLSISEERLDPEPTGTRELRDRAFTYLDDLVTEIREAGRYAFRKQPSVSKLFASRYRRRHRRGTKSTNEGELDVTQEETAS